MTAAERVSLLRRRIETTWSMAQVYFYNRDAHGVMDMGAELEALQRAVAELEAIEK